ncbi:MAG: serpin family protein [Ruminiclostridium sp.]|nr:serpin family protein [Ruminiclostridium sp.]MBQ9933041.1 serpin family protein [Ruminiclostridium sp.]
MKKRLLTLGLALTFLLSLTACASQKIQAEELTAGVHTGNHSGAMDFDGPETLLVNDFAVRLFQQTMAEGENTLLSPISVLSALAMAANGAQGETLTQIEEVFGLSVPELNNYLYCWEACLENYKATVNWANSLWIKTGTIQVEEDFLRSCIQWYNAEVYEAPFDQTTVKDLNLWVEEHTDGMIKEMVSEFSSDTVLCLVNALAFDAEWERIYYDYQVQEDYFTREDGTRQEGTFMYSDEDYYWEDDLSTGVMKYYEGDVYAFVGLLPKEGVTLEEYVDTLTGESVHGMLTGFQNAEVSTKLPKFRTETTADLITVLQSMGMSDIFDPALADLSGMGSTSTGMLYINQVLHKTFINVDEKGTQAGAATMVAAGEGAEAPHEVKQVHLDRPFLYMIVDTRNHIPLFIGTMTDIT